MARPNCAVQLRAGGEWAPAVRGRKVKGGFMVTLSGGASNNAPIFVSAPCVRPLSWAGCKRARESQGDAASPPRKRGPAAPTRRQIYINREIAREGTLSGLVRIAGQNVTAFNLVNCVTTVQRLAKLQRGSDDIKLYIELVQKVLEKATHILKTSPQQCQPRQAANGIWGLARLSTPIASGSRGTKNESATAFSQSACAYIVQAMGAACSAEKLNPWKPQEVANALWGLGKLLSSGLFNYVSHQLPDPFQTAVQRFLDSLPQRLNAVHLTPQGVSNTVWGLAKVSEGAMMSVPVATLKSLLTTAAARIPGFDEKSRDASQQSLNAQEMSNTLWGTARILAAPGAEKLISQVGPMASQLCAVVVSALSRMLSEAFAEKDSPDVTSQQLANSVWAVAKLYEKKITSTGGSDTLGSNPGIPTELSEAVVQRLQAWNAHEIVSLAWAYTTLPRAFQDLPSSIFQSVASRGIAVAYPGIPGDSQSLGLEWNQLAMLAWCAGKAVPDDMGARALLRAISALVCEEYSKNWVGSTTISSLSPQDIANLAWSLARAHPFAGDAVPSAVSSLAIVAAALLTEPTRKNGNFKTKKRPFETRHLANIVWAMGRVSETNEAFEEASGRAVIKKAADFNGRDLANTAWGFAVMFSLRGAQSQDRKIKPRRKDCPLTAALHALAEAASDKVDSLNAQELSKFLWAMSKAHVQNKKLEAAAMSKRHVDVFVPGLNALDGTPLAISLASIPGGGRNLQNTGTAFWDASLVLAEWLARAFGDQDRKDNVKKRKNKLMPGRNASCLDGFAPRPRKRAVQWRRVATAEKLKKRIRGVELGAGLGLPSIVAAHMGVRMTATDGDPEVLKLLRENCKNNVKGVEGARLRVKKMRWGRKNPQEKLGLKRAADLVIASGVVYGIETEVFRALAKSIQELSDEHTLVVLAHGQGAAPGVHRSEGPFFQEIESRGFVHVQVPDSEISEEHRKHGAVLHLLKLVKR